MFLGLYVLLALIILFSFFFLKQTFEQNDLRLYWTYFHQIFTKALFDRRLLIWPLFTKARGTLPWQPILGSKLAKSDYSPLFVVLAFRNGLQYRHSDFLAILFVNLVNSGSVTPEFTSVVGVHPTPHFKKVDVLIQIISGSNWPIFTTFAPCGGYLIVHFSIAQGTLPWQPMLASRLAKSAYSPLFVALAFWDGLQYRISDFKSSSTMICLHRVNIWWTLVQ